MSRHSDEYNPMLDDYNDPEFNSYTSQGFKTTKSSKSGGLIDRAQNPTYELHISRIPIDFTELGLQNIFGQYGTVVKTFLCRPKLPLQAQGQKQTSTWGKVTYGSVAETREAIENLHMKPPYYFVISTSISNEEKEKRDREKEEHYRHAGLVTQRQDEYLKTHGLKSSRPEDELSQRQEALTKISQQYSKPTLQHGHQSLPVDHQLRADLRDMSSGREDEWFQCNAMDPKAFQQVQVPTSNSEFDRRPFVHGSKQILPESSFPHMGPCHHCGKMGNVRCSVCKEWYCSQKCQINDWPRHKSACRPPPDLEYADGPDPIFIEEQRQLLERFKKMTVRNYIARTQLEKMYLERDIARLEQMYLDIRMYYNIAQKLHYELNKMPEENNEHNRNSPDPIFIEEQRQSLERFKQISLDRDLAQQISLGRDLFRFEQTLDKDLAQQLHGELNKMAEDNNEHNRRPYQPPSLRLRAPSQDRKELESKDVHEAKTDEDTDAIDRAIRSSKSAEKQTGQSLKSNLHGKNEFAVDDSHAEITRLKAEYSETKKKADSEAKRKAEEEEARLKAETKKKAEEEEARLLAEFQARKKAADLEAKRKAEEEARLKAENDAQKRSEAEAKKKAADLEAKRKAEEEACLKAKADTQKRAEAEAKKKAADSEAKRKAEEACLKAKADAQKRAEAEAKKKAADLEAKRKAEEAEQARLYAEAKKKAEQEAMKIVKPEKERHSPHTEILGGHAAMPRPMAQDITDTVAKHLNLKECATSILQVQEVTNVIEIAVTSSEEVDAFIGTCVQTDVINYLCSELPNEVGKRALHIQAGDFVLVYDQQEENYARNFVLAIDGDTVEVMDIDFPEHKKVPKSNVFLIPKKAQELPACGVCIVISINAATLHETVEKYIRKMIEINSNTVQFRILEKNMTKKGLLKSFNVDMIEDADGKSLAPYLIQPWTAMDSRIPKLLGLPSLIKGKIMYEDLEDPPVKKGHDLVYISFGPSSNLLIVTTIDIILHEEDLIEFMAKEIEIVSKPMESSSLVKGQIVAARWSEDEKMYRALITDINLNLGKVKVRFIDYGNQSIEKFGNLFELPEAASKIPVLAKLIQLDGVPDRPNKDPQVGNRLKQLEPLLHAGLVVKEVKEDGGVKKYVVEHPNGSLINEIISKKLNEEMDTPIPFEIQGQEMGGHFDYNVGHIASLIKNDASLEQNVMVLYAENPQNIFVCPSNQIGLAENIATQVDNYAKIDENMVGFAPKIGKMCVAQSMDDDGWYRGACVGFDEDKFVIFFVDYGFKEVLTRNRLKMIDPLLMKTVFFANHCVLKGFENSEMAPCFDEKYGQIVKERLPFGTDLNLHVLKQDVQSGYFIIEIPKILEDLNPDECIEKTSEDAAKELRIKELEAQLEMLRKAS